MREPPEGEASPGRVLPWLIRRAKAVLPEPPVPCNNSPVSLPARNATGAPPGSRGPSRFFRPGAIFLLLFLFPWSGQAQMMGDPVPEGQAGFSSLSVEYDDVQLNVDSANSQYGGTLQSDQVLVRADLGVGKKSDLFLWVGGIDAQAAQRVFQGGAGPAFGGGARQTLLQWGDLRVGAGLQALQLYSRDDSSQSPKFSLSEVGAVLGADLLGLPFFRPYGGLEISDAQGKFWGGETTARVFTPNWVSVFLGGEFRIWKRFWFGAEARLIEEYSFGVRLSFRP